MNKMGLLVVGSALLIGSMAVAQTGVVTSVNIVGFNKITCAKGKWILVSSAFKSLSGAPLKSADVIGTQLPLGSSTYAYSPQLHRYLIDNYAEDDNGDPAWGTNLVYQGGMGFWINVPADAPQASYDVYLMGEVPVDASSSNIVFNGFTMMGYPYTANIVWTNTSLAKTAQLGDSLYTWTPATGVYQINNYAEDDNGDPAWGNPNLVLTPGMGFWYQTASSLHTNIEIRPYNP